MRQGGHLPFDLGLLISLGIRFFVLFVLFVEKRRDEDGAKIGRQQRSRGVF